MAKVFGKKRADLLRTKKLKQYFKYAIGEIILVVIGILIALGINNLNIQHQNKNQEKVILEQLLVEYEANLEEIENKIKMRNMIMRSIEHLIFYADQGIENEHMDSISLFLDRTHYDPTYDPANGVTNELLNSGRFYLIQNDELKNQLTSWSGVVSELTEQEQLTAKLIYEKYIPYMNENFDMRSTMSRISDKKMDQLFTVDQSRTFSVPRTISIETLRELLNDKAFQNYVILIGRMHLSGNRQSLDTKADITKIIELIKSEIE